MINCVVISNDLGSVELINPFLERVPYLNNVGTYRNYFDALRFIKRRHVDVVWVDLDVPDMNGLQFIRSLVNPPKFVLISSNKEHAIDGFDLNALDFLLKPLTLERFMKACERSYNLMLPQETSGSMVEDFIMVKVEHYVHRISVKDIFYIEGFKDYVKIHTHDSAPIMTIKSLKAIESMLPRDLFIRIHRSYIVSVNKISSYRNNKVKVKDTFLSIGDSYKHQFQQQILSEVI